MIYVVGSSFNSLAAANAFVNKGLDVTILDVGKKPSLQNKQIIKDLLKKNDIYKVIKFINSIARKNAKNYPKIKMNKTNFGSHFYREKLINDIVEQQLETETSLSYALGGFSNIWGAACLPILKEEMKSWPIKYEDLSEHFDEVSKLLNVNGENDDLNNFFNFKNYQAYEHGLSSQSKELLKQLNFKREDLKKSGIHFGRSKLAINNSNNGYKGCVECGLCFHGCPHDIIFNTSDLFKDFIKNKKINYIPNIKVKSFDELNNEVTIYAENMEINKMVEFKAEYLFLGSGSISTMKILMDTLKIKKDITLASKDQYVAPIYLKFKSKLDYNQNYNTLSEIFIEVNDNKICENNVHIQIYPFSDIILSFLPFFKKFFSKYFNFIFRRLMIAQILIPSKFSPLINVTLSEKNSLILKSQNNKTSSEIIKKVIKKINQKKSLGFSILNKLMIRLSIGGSQHLGSSFKMSNEPKVSETDIYGRPLGFKNVHIIDSTILPSLPTATIVFASMSNSLRIAKAVISKILSEKN